MGMYGVVEIINVLIIIVNSGSFVIHATLIKSVRVKLPKVSNLLLMSFNLSSMSVFKLICLKVSNRNICMFYNRLFWTFMAGCTVRTQRLDLEHQGKSVININIIIIVQ